MSLVKLRKVKSNEEFYPNWTKCILSWKNCENCKYSVDDVDKYLCRIGSFVIISNLSTLEYFYCEGKRYYICQ